MKVAPVVKNKSKSEFDTEIGIENRRATGATKALLKAFQGSPGRFVPKNKSLTLKGMMSGGRGI